MTIELYPFQAALIENLRQSMREGSRRPLLVSPTGSGKTIMFGYLASRMATRGVRSHILAHRKELIRQISTALDLFGAEHSFVAAGRPFDPEPLIHIGSVYTVARRLDSVPIPDYNIIDEAHHALPGSTWGTCFTHWHDENPRLHIFGVTATPERLSGEGMGQTFDRLVLGPTTKELIENGYLAPYRIFAPARTVSAKELHVRGGDFKREEIEDLMNRREITGGVIEHYRKYLDGKPSVAFCVSVAHAEQVAEQFRQAGYIAASIDGSMKTDKREKITDAFAVGRINVLCSCDLISEGYDVPGIYGAILLRPTLSKALYLQQVGRALRFIPGKTAVILDHVGNWLRHGLPCGPQEWSLDSKTRRKRLDPDPDDIDIRQCPKCGYVFERDEGDCPECGFEFPKQSREIEEKEGELVELDPEDKALLSLPFKVQLARCQDFKDLLHLGKLRGMKNPYAWASHVHRNRKR